MYNLQMRIEVPRHGYMSRAGGESDNYKFMRCYLLYRIEQSLNAVGLFPAHAEVLAPHVTVGGELAVG